MLHRSGRCGLNVLGIAQAGLASTFARKGGSTKFDGVSWSEVDGVPRLPGVRGFLSCAVAELVDGGDHVVVLADVRSADSGDGLPLTYHSRVFGTHRALEEVTP